MKVEDGGDLDCTGGSSNLPKIKVPDGSCVLGVQVKLETLPVVAPSWAGQQGQAMGISWGSPGSTSTTSLVPVPALPTISP